MGKYYTATISGGYKADVTNNADEATGYNADADFSSDLENYKDRINEICAELNSVKAALKVLKADSRTGLDQQNAIESCIKYIGDIETQLKSKTKKLRSLLKQIQAQISAAVKAWQRRQAAAATNSKVNIDN